MFPVWYKAPGMILNVLTWYLFVTCLQELNVQFENNVKWKSRIRFKRTWAIATIFMKVTCNANHGFWRDWVVWQGCCALPSSPFTPSFSPPPQLLALSLPVVVCSTYSHLAIMRAPWRQSGAEDKRLHWTGEFVLMSPVRLTRPSSPF